MTPVTLDEIKSVLALSKNDKSPGPDGIPVEVYRVIFYVMGMDLLRVIEDSRKNGKIPAIFNSTFIALIPKSDFPNSFDGFRPISLCNFSYKVIGKLYLPELGRFWADISRMSSLGSCLVGKSMMLWVLFRKAFILFIVRV